jgi:hypothetical protein
VGTFHAGDLPVLHLQWVLAERTQMRQAWYRCREWLDGRSGCRDQRLYSITLPDSGCAP